MMDDARLPTRSSQRFTLAFLFVICAVNFLDRTIVNVLGESIKTEMQLSDAMLGLVTGLGFAILYAVASIPLARLAERYNRVSLISICLVFWSAATAMCGLATGALSLFLARVGVGVGEAGYQPAAHSIISDLYGPERRSGALSIYSIGGSLGVVVGALGAGALAQHIGWRGAFIVAGLPGIVLAVAFWLLIREPVRGGSEPGTAARAPAVPMPLLQLLRTLVANRAFVHLWIGATLSTFVLYGMRQFTAPYYIRGFQVSLAEAGLALAVVSGIGGAIGTLCGGLLADRAGRRSIGWYALIPAIGLTASVPFFAIAFGVGAFLPSVVALVLATLCQALFLGPTLGVVHNMVGARERASTIAIMFFAVNLIAIGFGPAVAGAFIDYGSAHAFGGDVGAFLAACVEQTAAHRPPSCAVASIAGTRLGLGLFVLLNLWSAMHYGLAAIALRKRAS